MRGIPSVGRGIYCTFLSTSIHYVFGQSDCQPPDSWLLTVRLASKMLDGGDTAEKIQKMQSGQFFRAVGEGDTAAGR